MHDDISTLPLFILNYYPFAPIITGRLLELLYDITVTYWDKYIKSINMRGLIINLVFI